MSILASCCSGVLGEYLHQRTLSPSRSPLHRDMHVHKTIIVILAAIYAPKLAFIFVPHSSSLYLSSLHPESGSIGPRCAFLKHLDITPEVQHTADWLTLLSAHATGSSVCCPPPDSAVWKHLSNSHTLLIVKIDGSSCPLDLDDFKLAPFLNVATLSFGVDKAADITTLIHELQHHRVKCVQ